MVRGVWWATVHVVAKNRTQLSYLAQAHTSNPKTVYCQTSKHGESAYSNTLSCKKFEITCFCFVCTFQDFVVVQLLSHVWLFVTPWTAAHQAPLSSISWSLVNPMSIELMMSSNHLILCHPLLILPSIFPSMSLFQWIRSLHQLAKILELLQQSFPRVFRVDFLWDWLVWSPCCQRDSQESSLTPQFESINCSMLSLFYGPTLTSIHNYWKDHSFNYMDFCWQNDVFAS